MMGLRGPHLPASRGATDKLGDTARPKIGATEGRDIRGFLNSLLGPWCKSKARPAEQVEYRRPRPSGFGA